MRGPILKTSFVVGLAVMMLLVVSVFNPLEAAPIVTYDYGTAQAAFKVIDNFGTGTGDGSVTLAFISTFSGLEYQYGGSGWNPVSLSMVFPGFYLGSLVVNTGVGQSKDVYFQKTSNTTSTTAAIVFSGFDNPLWNNVLLNFNYNSAGDLAGLLSATPSSGDHVAPVPLPASLWILGSGLLGLIGIRRKITH
jgi:hypothetical protein